MKRFDPKNKYLGWGITAFGVIACCILFYMLLQHGKSIGDAISSLLGILSPIIWGLVIAYLLWPLTKVFQRKLFEPLLKKLRPKKPVRTSLARGLSVALSILVALIIIAALIWLIIPQIYTSVESIVLNYQEYYDTITGWINKFFENNPEVEEVLLSATGDVSDSLLDWAKTALLPSMGKVVTSVTTGIYAVLRAILDVLIGFVVACYVLSNMELFLAKSKMVLYSMFSVKASKRILKAIRFTDTAFMGFISGKVIDSAIIGVICYICCAIMRMPYVVLVSVIVAVTNIIPVFGPFIGAVPTALIILLVSPMKCLIYVIFIIVLQQIDGNIIGPEDPWQLHRHQRFLDHVRHPARRRPVRLYRHAAGRAGVRRDLCRPGAAGRSRAEKTRPPDGDRRIYGSGLHRRCYDAAGAPTAGGAGRIAQGFKG